MEESINQCQTPDDVASRAPKDEGEEAAMFKEGLYTGYFRATELNNCTENKNCTGHFAGKSTKHLFAPLPHIQEKTDYPCG